MDEILRSFLDYNFPAAEALAAESNLLEVVLLRPQHMIANFACKGLVRTADGEIREHAEFSVGFHFPDHYLSQANPFEVLTWLGPHEAWHPNIWPPAICIGHIDPGTPIPDLLYRTYEVITYVNSNPIEQEALNHHACAWARDNQHRFPIDSRALKRPLRERRLLPTAPL